MMLQKRYIIFVAAVLLILTIVLIGTLQWNSSLLDNLLPPGHLTPFPVVHPGWTSYTNTDDVQGIDFDREGNLWVASTGGVLEWNLKKHSYAKFTVENGLPTGELTSVTVAPDGTVWLGTSDEGIVRFDGQTWLTYLEQYGSGPIGHIAAAPDSTVWTGRDNPGVGPAYGIWHFDGQTGTHLLEDNPVYDTVKSIAVTADGVAWLGTYEGLWSYDGQDWTCYTEEDGLASDAVLSLSVAQDGTLWVGTVEGVISYDGETWETHTQANSLSEYQILHIDASAKGYVWIYGEYTDYSSDVVENDEALARFDGKQWTTFEKDGRLLGAQINSLASTSNGEVWLGTSNGVWSFDGRKWQQYIETNTPPEGRLEDVAVSKNGVVWVASAEAGAASFDGRTWTNYPYSDPIAIASNDVVWASTEKGLASFDGDKWRVYEDIAAITHGITAMAIAPDNTVWAGLWTVGIGHFDGETWTVYRPDDSLQNDCAYVRDIAVDSDGVVWIGFEEAIQQCEGGLARFDGEEWTLYTSNSENGWTSNTVNSVTVASDGGVWVGTQDGDVSQFNRETWQSYPAIRDLEFEIYPGHFLGLGGGSPTLAIEADGSLWAGIHIGVLKLDGQKWSLYRTTDGLVNDTVTSIAIGPSGEVWFATNNGLSRYRPPNQ